MNEIIIKTGKEGYKAEIISGNHAFFADEPISAGGTDTGPNPYEYLLAALGSCTALTLRLYANNKKWPVDAIEVHVSHTRDYLKDCEDCPDKDAKIEHIDIKIKITGNISQEQLDRMLDISTRCPVHKTLDSKVDMSSSLIYV